MENDVLVSILINNYNYGRFLSKAIDSALAQTHPCKEVIVVDDGSTDNSREVIAGYGEKITAIFQENGGQAVAFNTGFVASQGEIICFLDADDFFYPEKVTEIVKAFHSYPQIGWCFHPLELQDRVTGKFLGKSREKDSRLCDFTLHARRGKIPFYAPPTSALSFRKSLLAEVLPMPKLPSVSLCADRYLTTAALASSPGFYLDSVLAIQYIHGNNGFNFNPNIDKVRASCKIANACALKSRYPELARYANREFGDGLTEGWKAGQIKSKFEPIIGDYWSSTSLIDKLEIAWWMLYAMRPRRKVSRHRQS